SALAAKPLAVEEVGAGELDADAGVAEPVDRLPIQALGGLAVAQQRSRAGLDAERPVGAAGAGAVRESLEGAGCALGYPAPGRCLDQLDRRPRWENELVRVLASPLRRGQRVLIATEA